jgi:CTP synthase (UTP-ammonia lyase)
MSHRLKIAIIGDYNFTFNSHQATNLALDHAEHFLEIDVNYYWVKLNEAAQQKTSYFDQFDGVWIAPGIVQNAFFLNGIIRLLMNSKSPVLITGEGYKQLLEVLINSFQLNTQGEKLISDNLIEGNHFERVQLVPHSKEFIHLYENRSTDELTSSRYSLYPQLIQSLTDEIIDVEAYNQFEEPEVISLKKHAFFLACAFTPQISSTREIPHPLIYTFTKACLIKNGNVELLK